MRILIADDEPDLRDTLKLLLEMRGHRVFLAADGEEAVNIALAIRPDVILMDVRMPKMDGLTATRLLRGRTETASTPVICTSGFLGDQYLGSEALRAGCNECLPKPVEWKKLEELLERFDASRRDDHSAS